MLQPTSVLRRLGLGLLCVSTASQPSSSLADSIRDSSSSSSEPSAYLLSSAPYGKKSVKLISSDTSTTSYGNSGIAFAESYPTLDVSLAAPLGSQDTSKPGLVLRVAQLDPGIMRPGETDVIANQVDYANAMIAGLFSPWYGTNTADTSTAVFGNTWIWTNAMDFNIFGSPGSFTSNYSLPGIPGVTLKNSNFAAEFQTYLVFPTAGRYRMGIRSSDGFRLSESAGLARQVLHVSGAGVDRDVAAVVSTTTDGNGGYGAPLPTTPITAPVVYLDGSSCPNLPATNLTGKIAVINNMLCNGAYPDVLMAYNLQTNGAIAAILLNDPVFGLPHHTTGTAPSPITIPVLCVNGFGGEADLWITNANLIATIGASQGIQVACADYTKEMTEVEFAFDVPQAGVYPMHLIYEQGGGTAGLEWYSILNDGKRVLINDPNTPGSLMAYQTVTVKPRPTLQVTRTGNITTITYTGTLQASSTINGTFTDVNGASSPYTVNTSAASQRYYRARN
ncbi:MAG TPA: PA domain-containing protein [Clostridia bacterium]|nr:PA domain-containing protein [Clostridia bacterium]